MFVDVLLVLDLAMISTDKVVFDLDQVVYLVVNLDRTGMITGITFRPHGVTYEVTWDDFEERVHYACELTTEKTFDTKKK